jgi:uncharacterized protein (DUF488 family)
MTGHSRSERTQMEIHTVGHSTRSLDEFLDLLEMHDIGVLADVRTIPRSGRNPQFNAEILAGALAEVNIDYVHLPGLGGFRRPRPDSANTAWDNESFRGFADYMQTPQFTENLDRAIALAGGKRAALMCAEAVPWKCHRMLISDALTARGIGVKHIIDESHVVEHRLTRSARVEGSTVQYPGQPELKGSGHDETA